MAKAKPNRKTDPACDLRTRALSLRPETIDLENRTVEAVIATENRATVYDMGQWRRVEEILVMRGCEIPEQIVMLDSHQRYSTDDVRGSIRDMQLDGAELVGTLRFADDEASLRAWNKVKDGHLRDISTGNRGLDSVEIPPNTTRRVDGKLYTAGALPLIITRRWTPVEGSLVPIGADPKSKIREHVGAAPDSQTSEFTTMNELLRKYLETLGLRAAATEEQAQTFYESLPAADRTRADGVRDGWFDPFAGTERSAPPATTGTPPSALPPVAPPTPTVVDEATIRAEAMAAERTRQAKLREMAGGDVPDELLTRAINEGWTTERAAPQFLTAVRDRRTPPASAGAPAMHVHGPAGLEAIQSAMIIRAGLDPIAGFARFDGGGCYQPWLEHETREPLVRAAEQGWRYRDLSMIDLCREAIRLDGRQIPASRQETIRTAVSGGSLSAIFSTTVNAQLMASYQETADSTIWVRVNANIADFKTNERALMGKVRGMKKVPRGGTADHVAPSDQKEEYKVARYGEQFVVDEQDIIDDRFDALRDMPMEMGADCRRLRPDLVYAILLANAALGADSITLFHASEHGANLGTAALGSDGAGLKAGILAMAKQTQNGVNLNVRPQYLIVPQDLRFDAQVLLKSAQMIAVDMASDASRVGGNMNPLSMENIQLISENRIGTAGVIDPNSGTAHVGLATNYFLAAAPSQAPTIEVGYLRATGMAPVVRSFTLDKGQWGIGWDVKLDIGAKALDYRGLYKSTGAA